jgi:hypothetical protein
VAADFPLRSGHAARRQAAAGSKRVPILKIGADGRAQLDLWCRSGAAQVKVAGGAIKFTLGPLREDACMPKRTERDEAMIAAQSPMTQRRPEEDVVVLSGPSELRFYLSSH